VPTQPSPTPPPPPPPPTTNPVPPAPTPSVNTPANPLGDLSPSPSVNTGAAPANPLGDLPPAPAPGAPANPLGDLPTVPAAAAPKPAFQSTPALEAAIEKTGDLIFKEKDYAAAWKVLQPAIDAGHPEAFYYAGLMNHFGYGMPKDPLKAVEYYSRGAAAGSWYCVNNLGICLRDGIGVAQNFAEARKCFNVAAMHGNQEAGWNLGAMMINGQGAAADRVEGCAWLSASGHPQALKQLPELMARMSDADKQQVKARADDIRSKMAADAPKPQRAPRTGL
jgi:hypothetical protein